MKKFFVLDLEVNAEQMTDEW